MASTPAPSGPEVCSSSPSSNAWFSAALSSPPPSEGPPASVSPPDDPSAGSVPSFSAGAPAPWVLVPSSVLGAAPSPQPLAPTARAASRVKREVGRAPGRDRGERAGGGG